VEQQAAMQMQGLNASRKPGTSVKLSGHVNSQEHCLTIERQVKKQRGRAIEYILSLSPDELTRFSIEKKLSCSDLLKHEFLK